MAPKDSFDFGSVPVDDTDISGMDPDAAREYVLGFIKSLKETRRQRERLVEDLGRWRERIGLAQRQARTDLAEQAGKRAESLRDEVAKLDREEEELKAKVAILKENLKRLQGCFRYTVDAEQLLAQLEMAAGERDDTVERIKEIEVQSRLEELKRKIEEQETEK
jgi:phage shock protein A